MANIDLTQYGITGTTEIVYNPSYEELYKEETDPSLTGYEVGHNTELGAVDVFTGIYTGRSPKDKFIVMDDNSKDTVWWNTPEYPNDNHPASQEAWTAVKEIAKKELSNKKLYVVDGFCGANKDTRMAVRFIMEVAWQAHFVKNMFIRPTEEEQANFKPDFIVYNASKAKVENYKELGLNSETAVVFNITSHEQVIINTWYGGEMKKGMFSMMNYYLPLKGIASMHCSANTDLNGEHTSIFFGLSGTGKTTLSTDPKRLLIGDDEHGWDDNGVFNLEGGCYAKVINLDKDAEPDIYGAIKRDALLENVTVDARPERSISQISQLQRILVYLILSTTSRRSLSLSLTDRLQRTLSSFQLMLSEYFLLYLSLHQSRPSTTSFQDSLQSLLVQREVSQSLLLHSQLASDRHSSSFILQSTLKSSLRRWRRAALRLILLIQDGTEPEREFLSRIPEASSQLSRAVTLTRLLQRRSLTSISRFRLSFQA